MSKKFTFVTRKKLGVCPCCAEDVYDNELFVDSKEDGEAYHFSCYNYMKEDGRENGK